MNGTTTTTMMMTTTTSKPTEYDTKESARLFALRVCAQNRVSTRLLLLPTDEMAEQWYQFGFRGWQQKLMREAIRGLVGDAFLRVDGGQLLSITPRGAEFWESHDKPRWERFSRQRWRNKGTQDRFSMMCGSAEHRDRAIGALIKTYRLSCRFGLRNLRFRHKPDWQATYWKTLNSGYFFSCDVQDSEFGAVAPIKPETSRATFFPWGKIW